MKGNKVPSKEHEIAVAKTTIETKSNHHAVKEVDFRLAQEESWKITHSCSRVYFGKSFPQVATNILIDVLGLARKIK